MINRRLPIMFGAVAILLFIPLIAMQFTEEVQWTLSDFTTMAILLLLTAISCEIVLRKVKKPAYKLLLCTAVLSAFLLIWAELAVGIFGTPIAGS